MLDMGLSGGYQIQCLIISWLGFLTSSLADASIAAMTCPATQVGQKAGISCTAGLDASIVSISRNSQNLTRCNTTVCGDNLPRYRIDVTRNRTHQKVSLTIEDVQTTDEGTLICDVEYQGLNSTTEQATCSFYVFVPPEKPSCKHTSNSTHVIMTCSTAKVYPSALCNWTVTSLARVSPKLKTLSELLDPFFNTTCLASFPHKNQTDHKITVAMFPATVHGVDVSNGVALVTIDLTPALHPVTGENGTSHKVIVIISFISLLIVISAFLIYRSFVKRTRRHETEPGTSRNSFIKALIDNVKSPEPQTNKIGNSTMENPSELTYNSECGGFYRTSQESTPCTEQQYIGKQLDIATEYEADAVQTKETQAPTDKPAEATIPHRSYQNYGVSQCGGNAIHCTELKISSWV